MKHRVSFVLAGLVVLCLLQASGPSSVLACSCFPPTPEDALEQADAVFSGKVVSVKDRKVPGKNGGSYIEHAYTFEVETGWKGVRGPRVTAYFYSDYLTADGLGLTGCTAEGFEVGETYMVYASRGGVMSAFSDGQNALSASLSHCDRTVLLNDAGEDLRALGPGMDPAPQGPLLGVAAPALLEAIGWVGNVLAWILGLLR